jgi:hypothetical protein
VLHLRGTVYILENSEAKRVKIGVTINNPSERLKDINRMWLGTKGRCQVCGNRRLLELNGLMPKHVLSGKHCSGSHALPLERDKSLAIEELERLKGVLEGIQGKSKGSAVKRVKSLEKLIDEPQDVQRFTGSWSLKASFKSEIAYQVEELVHETLNEYLDVSAPFGEVFSCSAEEAVVAIENAHSKLGLTSQISYDLK